MNIPTEPLRFLRYAGSRIAQNCGGVQSGELYLRAIR